MEKLERQRRLTRAELTQMLDLYERLTKQNRRIKKGCWITLITLVALIGLVLDLCLCTSFPVYRVITSRARGAAPEEEQQQQQQLEAPVCRLGNHTHRIGELWTPYLPGVGVQYCMRCECTLKYMIQQRCHTPVSMCQRFDRFPYCPEAHDACPEGQKLRSDPGHCCPRCVRPDEPELPELAQPSLAPVPPPTATKSRVPGSSWQIGPASGRKGQQLYSQRPPPINERVEPPQYDLSPGDETFFLLKVVARSADERELISAVKSISFCRPPEEPQPTPPPLTPPPPPPRQKQQASRQEHRRSRASQHKPAAAPSLGPWTNRPAALQHASTQAATGTRTTLKPAKQQQQQ